MGGAFWVIGAGTVIFAAVLTFGMTRRYGWGQALALPLLALAAMLAMQWQERAETGFAFSWASLVFAMPVLLGAVAGIVVARIWRR